MRVVRTKHSLTVQCIFGKERPPHPESLPQRSPVQKYISVMFYDNFFQNSVAKYLEKKGESLEKLNCNLVSETARTTVRIQVNSWKRIVFIQVSNYPFSDMQIRCTFS